MRRARNTLSITVLGYTQSGCAASIDAFGFNPAYAKHNADHLFAAFAHHFYEVRRDSSFNRARELMGQFALTPSRLLRDATLWNAPIADSTRSLIVGAAFTNQTYTFAANRQAPHPSALGDQRQALTLTWLGGGASAFGDFSGRTELEETLFLYETFEALGKDIR